MNPDSNPMLIRKRVVKKALNRTPITHLARQYMVSRRFVYKWIKRYRENPKGEWWEERSRRPERIRRKVTPKIRAKIIKLRRAYGLNIMQTEQWFKRKGLTLSHTTIWKVLQQEGEPPWRAKPPTKKARKRFERPQPNDLWQLDIKGPFWVEEQGQHLYLLTILDDHSRFLLESRVYPHPINQQEILTRLQHCFQLHGHPKQILTDNGAQFHSMRGGTSTFTRVLAQEGVKHIRSRVFHPETCGKVERQHGTTLREMKRLGLKQCNADHRRYRDHFNFFRPHQGIALKTPGERFMNHPPEDILPQSVTHVY
ncbi:MAG: DDE-type integrase/transposase/recombinase [Candidatus Heimdallarchaeaceae archaeon]